MKGVRCYATACKMVPDQGTEFLAQGDGRAVQQGVRKGREAVPARIWFELGSTPALDYAIKGDKLVIRAELPGVEPDKVDISVTGNLLTIRGERKEEKEVKEEDYCIHEIGTGVFERTLTLPEGVDSDKIKASYKNGILQVTMPAAEIKKGKKVQVEVEEPKKLKAA